MNLIISFIYLYIIIHVYSKFFFPTFPLYHKNIQSYFIYKTLMKTDKNKCSIPIVSRT